MLLCSCTYEFENKSKEKTIDQNKNLIINKTVLTNDPNTDIWNILFSIIFSVLFHKLDLFFCFMMFSVRQDFALTVICTSGSVCSWRRAVGDGWGQIHHDSGKPECDPPPHGWEQLLSQQWGIQSLSMCVTRGPCCTRLQVVWQSENCFGMTGDCFFQYTLFFWDARCIFVQSQEAIYKLYIHTSSFVRLNANICWDSVSSIYLFSFLFILFIDHIQPIQWSYK